MKYKILLSAYSCEPNRGSESEVGWSWATNLAKQGHTVYVATRKNQKNQINKFLKTNKTINLKFIYFDYPKFVISVLKPKFLKNSYLYFFLWQLGLFFKVRPYINSINFDFIHHVTFVSYRIPSFLILYNIPFIFGPVSGGDTVPINLRKNFRLIDFIKEYLRDLSNLYLKFSPLMNLVFLKSNKIFVNSFETKNNILKIFHKKITVLLAIGMNSKNKIQPKEKKTNEKLKICFAGNLIDIKGIKILLDTFTQLQSNINCELNIYGDGIMSNYIKKIIKKRKLNNFVNIFSKTKRDIFLNLFKKNHLLLMPALRDSGSYVTLEAMSLGIPCAVLNIGGPDILVDNNCGIKIKCSKKKHDQIVSALTKSIIKLNSSPILYKKKSCASIQKVEKFTWNRKISEVYY